MFNRLDEVLAKAVATLPENTARSRRTIYARARVSLVEQLRKVDPPLSVREISDRRLMLEAGIQRIERQELSRLNGAMGQ